MLRDSFRYSPSMHGELYDYYYPRQNYYGMSNNEQGRGGSRYNLRRSQPPSRSHQEVGGRMMAPMEDRGIDYMPEDMLPVAGGGQYQADLSNQAYVGVAPQQASTNRGAKRVRRTQNEQDFAPPGDDNQFPIIPSFSTTSDTLSVDSEPTAKRYKGEYEEDEPNASFAPDFDDGMAPMPAAFDPPFNQQGHLWQAFPALAGTGYGMHQGAAATAYTNPASLQPQNIGLPRQRSSQRLADQRNASIDDDDTETEDEEDDMKPAAEGLPVAAALDNDNELAGIGIVAVAAAAAAMPRRAIPHARPTELRLYPSTAELEAAPNPRAADALGTWYTRLRELADFKTEYDHVNVPQKYPPNTSLGIWVNKQRCTRDTLSDEKLLALDAVGFDWGKKKGDIAWRDKFEELVVYSATKGNCQVPTKCAGNPSLGRWVSTQRSQYKNYRNGIKTTMTAERVKQLNDIGFVWSMID